MNSAEASAKKINWATQGVLKMLLPAAFPWQSLSSLVVASLLLFLLLKSILCTSWRLIFLEPPPFFFFVRSYPSSVHEPPMAPLVA